MYTIHIRPYLLFQFWYIKAKHSGDPEGIRQNTPSLLFCYHSKIRDLTMYQASHTGLICPDMMPECHLLLPQLMAIAVSAFAHLRAPALSTPQHPGICPNLLTIAPPLGHWTRGDILGHLSVELPDNHGFHAYMLPADLPYPSPPSPSRLYLFRLIIDALLMLPLCCCLRGRGCYRCTSIRLRGSSS